MKKVIYVKSYEEGEKLYRSKKSSYHKGEYLGGYWQLKARNGRVMEKIIIELTEGSL